MATKVQTQLLIAEVTRDRADRLALVRNEPRAEILRLALEGGGLQSLEEQVRDGIAAFDSIAREMGMSGLALAGRAARDRFRLADLEGRKRYPHKA